MQIGAAMVLGTLVAIIIVDRSGRRTLLIAGGVQMCLAEVSSCLAGSAHAPLPRSCRSAGAPVLSVCCRRIGMLRACLTDLLLFLACYSLRLLCPPS